MPRSPQLYDAVGIFYITFCVTWSILVFGGMAFCLYHRDSPVLKLRGLPLSFTAITFLHCYWILGQITYPVGRAVPTVLAYDIQYFFMGIWFPLGIATFQASNSRFLHIAKLQKQFATPELRSKGGCNGAHSSWLCRLRNMPYSRRILIFIGLGMILQVLLTVGMWLACRKYHPTYGIPGTEIHGATLPEQLVDLGRGWEWWPTVLWQFIWTWIVAPILIWRAWGIRDTMGWRTQTIGCCLSNLHATPMFLIASYVPEFAKINPYFTPSQWIHLSVMMIEIFTIFVPLFQLIRLWVLAKKVTDTNAKWETASQTTTLRTSMSGEWKISTSVLEKGQSIDYLDECMGDRLLTMGALDHVLNDNPGPLQEFSALSDFSGENIAFLTRVAAWKSSWPGPFDEQHNHEAFNRALEIYTDFISPRDAEFPLNLASQDLKDLEGVFEKPTRILLGEAAVNQVTPFDLPNPFSGDEEQGTGSRFGDVLGRAHYTGEIPSSFNSAIFDTAQTHVKYLVLTNTWPKFVKEMQSRRRSSETERSQMTETSQTTLGSRVTAFIQSLV
ncbi:hypothetical protein BGZ63DRAFT_366029 [Mariannaea sp. PMI_226]|nr:hypothetical protein BGZ63DRAFT_366029 [Mariannaea sp. PMI_226]